MVLFHVRHETMAECYACKENSPEKGNLLCSRCLGIMKSTGIRDPKEIAKYSAKIQTKQLPNGGTISCGTPPPIPRWVVVIQAGEENPDCPLCNKRASLLVNGGIRQCEDPECQWYHGIDYLDIIPVPAPAPLSPIEKVYPSLVEEREETKPTIANTEFCVAAMELAALPEGHYGIAELSPSGMITGVHLKTQTEGEARMVLKRHTNLPLAVVQKSDGECYLVP